MAGRPDPQFQFNYQPLAYFAKCGNGTPGQAVHLHDEQDFLRALSGNTLPAVAFVKPLGADDKYPGYANLARPATVADLVKAVAKLASSTCHEARFTHKLSGANRAVGASHIRMNAQRPAMPVLSYRLTLLRP